MPIAAPLTSAQLRELINQNEKEQLRRDRLFIPFGGRRAELLNQLRDKVIEFIVDEQAALNGALVLDYGCGIQPYASGFQIVKAQIVGADIGKNVDAQVEISGQNQLPFMEGSFDFVISFQVLEHIPIPEEYINECYRVLKTGGKIFLTTHGLYPYHPTPGDFHRWTRIGLIQDLERGGFRTIYTKSILNEYSALIQSYVMTFDFNKRFRRFSKIYHFLAHVLIKQCERYKKRMPEIPGIIVYCGTK
ncbi:MAG TPA: hypothetical protein DCY35_04700 [Prolixibacteraceae bacterium]|nr:hypothetical protein [Prolixibacteraceae bacterium]